MDPTNKPATAGDGVSLQQEKDALRIQAAAVAAQQAALTEEEIRLQQERLALKQHEQQLASHLEDRRQRLLTLRSETRQAQEQLQAERAAYEKRVSTVLANIEHSRREVNGRFKFIQNERQRLLNLQRRLKQRWHRNWTNERAAQRRREAEVAEQLQALAKERQQFQQEKARITEVLLRQNAENELSRRQLQSEWDRFYKEQSQQNEHTRLLEQREAAVAEAENDLVGQEQQWEETRRRMGQEVEGLETRIGNYRVKIRALEQAVIRLETTARSLQEPKADAIVARLPAQHPAAPLAPAGSAPGLEEREWKIRQADADLERRSAALEKMAEELADQRLCLAEECERLAQAQACWQSERSAAAAELEKLGRQLREREQSLKMHEEARDLADQELRLQQGAVAQAQRQLAAWQARVAVGAAAWEKEREHLMAELQARQLTLALHQSSLDQLRLRWNERRRRQIINVRARRTAAEELRRQCLAMRAQCAEQRTAYLHQQRALAERALALEQYRQEFVAQASHPAVAEKKLEQLRRKWATLSVAQERALSQKRQQLARQAASLDERLRQHKQREDQLLAQETDFTTRQMAWEQQQTVLEGDQAKLRQEVQALQSQRELYERQLQELRDEVERLAKMLLEESDGPFLPIGQAA